LTLRGRKGLKTQARGLYRGLERGIMKPSKKEKIEVDIQKLFGNNAAELLAYLRSKYWYEAAISEDEKEV
jgi:hypothetical protein